MNRFVVMEAFIDEGNLIQMQCINIHASISAAYWHYPLDTKDRLWVINAKRLTTHTWDEVFYLMCYEQLVRLYIEGKNIEHRCMDVLQAYSYVDKSYELTTSGQDLIKQLCPPEALTVLIGKIESTSKMNMR